VTPAERQAHIVRRKAEGVRAMVIAIELGVTVFTVHAILRKAAREGDR